MNRMLKDIMWILVMAGALFSGIAVFKDRRYVLISLLIALSSCAMVYSAYEKKRGNVRRMVILSVLVAMAAAGRCIFAPVPGFNPISAISIMAAVYLGGEAGFITGSLSALVSDLFFGIGPWTPFQMCAWGFVAMIAGLPYFRRFFMAKIPLLLYGALSGLLYSAIMDIWTVLSVDGSFHIKKYIAAFLTSLPFVFVYAASNIIFLSVLHKPIGKKLVRMNKKHCIF